MSANHCYANPCNWWCAACGGQGTWRDPHCLIVIQSSGPQVVGELAGGRPCTAFRKPDQPRKERNCGDRRTIQGGHYSSGGSHYLLNSGRVPIGNSKKNRASISVGNPLCMDMFVFVWIWLLFFQMNKASVINHACLLFSTLPRPLSFLGGVMGGRVSQRIEVKWSYRIFSTGDAGR